MDKNRRNSTVVLAGGGTGGHFFPGIALAAALEERSPGIDIHFVGTEGGIESRLLPSYEYPFHEVRVPSLKKRSLLDLVSASGKLPFGGMDAGKVLWELDPDWVISLGGYAAGPITLMASLSGCDTALLEQNTVPGLTNRLLERFVDVAYLAFDSTVSHFQHTDCLVSGNPVRPEIEQMAGDFEYRAPDAEAMSILVLGGSGGAGTLNVELPKSLSRLSTRHPGLLLTHQCGPGRRDEVRGRYAEFAGDVEIVEFIADMPRAYRAADLVICRAGATTIAELLAVGLPSVLIPFPDAADDHQQKNAQRVARAGAALTVRDEEVGSSRLERLTEGLIDNPVSLENLASRAKQFGQPDAAGRVARDLLARS